MILITGATGNFGSNLALALQGKNIPFRAAARNLKEVKEKLGGPVGAVEFDWNKTDTFNNALKGISVVYLISPPFNNDFETKAAPFIDEAKKAGVTHIVLTTGLFTGDNPGNIFYKTEQLVKQSGINYTIIRPGFLFQNFINYDLQSVKQGVIFAPSGEGKASYVDVRDIAAATAEVLAEPEKHAGKIYAMTGKEALTHQEMADVLTEVTGRQTHHVNPTEEEYKQGLAGYNVPDFVYNFMAMLYATLKEGQWEKVSNDIKQLSGKTPRSFKEFVQENKEIFA